MTDPSAAVFGAPADTSDPAGVRGEAAGYGGAVEVELFNEELWGRDGREVLAETAARFVRYAA